MKRTRFTEEQIIAEKTNRSETWNDRAKPDGGRYV